MNHAELLYGGGVVTSDSVPQTYDPIYMDEARPTLTYNVIEHSADAGMSGDPNSFQQSLFEGNSTTGSVVLTGSSITVATGTTPFLQIPASGQVTIAQIDQPDVPSLAALNGETFTVTQGSTSVTFQFVDISNAANKPASGNSAIDFNSARGTIDALRAVMATAINNAFQGLLVATAPAGLYTTDYQRVGPSLNANLLLDNSINGMLVRIRTNAGEPVDTLTTSAQLNSRDITYVIGQNLEIAGNPGGPLLAAGNTSQLIQAGQQEIQAVPGSSLVDGSTFTVANAADPEGTVFEFDGVSLSILPGSDFHSGDILEIYDPANPGSYQYYEFETATEAVSDPFYTKITFAPTFTAAQMETAIEQAINGAARPPAKSS